MRTNRTTFPAAEVIPESELAPLNLHEIFGRTAPLEVDLGCGDGTFLVALASEFPARDFLGIERLPGRVRGSCRKMGRHKLANARVLAFDILRAVQQLLPRESVTVFHLLFPDPWPKRRHEQHRVVTAEFLRAASRALQADGELRIATDHADYFSAMQRVVAEVPRLTVVPDLETATQATTFEERFRERGLEIHRLVLRKSSPVR
ncbi:MAG: tRNA (guanosine(46)-N7)-methyltransferase TrmB [Verrucomicrobiota bacterium]|nr:tRNA (guanosine(46)-N7)-methyltransferase TrmB [Verrucomicrobiota bacterium]